MILSPEKLEVIAQAAAEVQRRIYYEDERYQPNEHDIGERLATRERSLFVKAIRELTALGWVPPDVLRVEIIYAIRNCRGTSAEAFADDRLAELQEQRQPASARRKRKAIR